MDLEYNFELKYWLQQVNGRFGMSTVLVDLNADGSNDLVVSAPSVGSQTLDYFGQVLVYLNNKLTGRLPTDPSIVINCTVSAIHSTYQNTLFSNITRAIYKYTRKMTKSYSAWVNYWQALFAVLCITGNSVQRWLQNYLNVFNSTCITVYSSWSRQNWNFNLQIFRNIANCNVKNLRSFFLCYMKTCGWLLLMFSNFIRKWVTLGRVFVNSVLRFKCGWLQAWFVHGFRNDIVTLAGRWLLVIWMVTVSKILLLDHHSRRLAANKEEWSAYFTAAKFTKV